MARCVGGHKWVCLDDLRMAAEGGPAPFPCLVYSFGIGNDPSFEYAMTNLGCQVYGYDHTVALNSTVPSFHAFKLGIAASKQKETKDLKTLTTLLTKNGHNNTTIIHYLKVSKKDLNAL